MIINILFYLLIKKKRKRNIENKSKINKIFTDSKNLIVIFFLLLILLIYLDLINKKRINVFIITYYIQYNNLAVTNNI